MSQGQVRLVSEWLGRGPAGAVGGHGGVVAGLHLRPMLTFVPVRKATWRSEVNLTRLPESVSQRSTPRSWLPSVETVQFALPVTSKKPERAVLQWCFPGPL